MPPYEKLLDIISDSIISEDGIMNVAEISQKLQMDIQHCKRLISLFVRTKLLNKQVASLSVSKFNMENFGGKIFY